MRGIEREMTIYPCIPRDSSILVREARSTQKPRSSTPRTWRSGIIVRLMILPSLIPVKAVLEKIEREKEIQNEMESGETKLASEQKRPHEEIKDSEIGVETKIKEPGGMS